MVRSSSFCGNTSLIDIWLEHALSNPAIASGIIFFIEIINFHPIRYTY